MSVSSNMRFVTSQKNEDLIYKAAKACNHQQLHRHAVCAATRIRNRFKTWKVNQSHYRPGVAQRVPGS